MPKTPLSILDLAPVPEGATPGEALRRSRDLAAHAESWGYNRFWLAEHHNMVGIASAATSVAIGYVLAGTSRIRVGSGGVMLPNHSPLVIAEQFGTLEALYPGRVDLGLGRAPGTDALTMQALRRTPDAAQDFPHDVMELQALFAEAGPAQKVRAVPGAGLNVPIWILGSSLFGAQLAAMLGLPFAFASHFAPDALQSALDVYRERFEPSEQLERPYAMVACNVVAADTQDEARRLFSSAQQSLRQPRARHARAVAAADRRHRNLLVAGREGACLAHVGLFLCRDRRGGRRAAARLRVRDGRRRDHRRRRHLRARGAAAVV